MSPYAMLALQNISESYLQTPNLHGINTKTIIQFYYPLIIFQCYSYTYEDNGM